MSQPVSPLLLSLTQNLKPFLNFRVAMAVLLSFALLFLILFFTISSAVRSHNPRTGAASDYIISETCKASRDPPTCRTSLSQLPHSSPSSAMEVIQSALGLSTDNLHTGRRMVQDILAASAANQNRSTTAKTCLEGLDYSEYRMRLTADALPRGRLKDARSWMSAALSYKYGCWSGLKYVNDTSMVNRTMEFFNSSLIRSSSDVLSMMVNYDVFGEKTGSWGPAKTERDGFWEPGSPPSGSAPSEIKLIPDVTVCKGGGACDYATVQEAVNAAPPKNGNRFVIWIKAGVYEEIVRVPLEKKNVVFVGDGMGKTVITGNLNVGLMAVPTYNSATLGVAGDGFMAVGLTIENTAGPDGHQAVAFRSDSDRSVVQNCEFLGNQDTLYAHSLRQFYKSCRIQGNVDFIFGNSAGFFQDCIILVASRQSKPEEGESNTVTAHGRMDPAQSTGFVFQNCVINGSDEYMDLYYSKPGLHKNYLGRPWKEFSRTVFVNCTLEALISVQGWMPWNGDFALKSLYFGEFGNRGPGSDTSARVRWSSRIRADRVYTYSLHNFIQGDEWVVALS